MTKTTQTKTDTSKAKRKTKGVSDMFGDVGVKLDVYLSGTELTIAELQALGTDDVLALDAALNSTVELRINDLVVGRGELVSVGDAFGVRIVKIGSESDA